MSAPTADDWAARYEAGTTPWDLRRPHPELVRRIPDLGPPGIAVVPGAGRGHDAGALAGAGWTVTAIEYVDGLRNVLQEAVGARGRAVIGDALAHEPGEPVDLVFDHTFFCAIPVDERPRFGAWAARIVRPGGLLASVVFPVGRAREDGGPPHGMTTADLLEVLDPAFELEIDTPAENPGRRSWAARWAVFRRV